MLLCYMCCKRRRRPSAGKTERWLHLEINPTRFFFYLVLKKIKQNKKKSFTKNEKSFYVTLDNLHDYDEQMSLNHR